MEKLKNIPSLRFPEFEGNWEVCKLGEVMNFKVTNSFSRENLNYEIGDVKNIHYGDIHTKFQTLFDITKESVPFVNEDISIDRISNDVYCKEGDIIFADASEDINDVGKSIEIKNLNGERLLSGLHTLLARPIENKFTIGFNGYLFRSNNVRVQIQKESQGSKVLSINVGRISGINLSFPSLQEQAKIATYFSAIDDKLQTLKRKKTLLEQYKKGVMQKIFSQELRFKDDTGNDYPDWENKKLGEISIITTGSTPSTIVEEYYGGEKLFVSPVDLQGNRFISNTKTTLTELGFAKGRKIKKGSVLFVCIGSTIGKVGIATEDCLTNQQINSLEALNGYENDYIYSLLDYYGSKIKVQAGIQAVPQINKTDFSNFSFFFPSIDEQVKIANFLSAIDDKINHCQGQMKKTEVWKKGLLQKMFC